MKKTGFKEFSRFMGKITPEVMNKLSQANRDNANDIVDVARVLIPRKTGTSATEIRTLEVEDGAQLMDFGKKAKVIEGQRGPRPFVNPALKATDKKRRARNRKALRDAIKAAK